ncbi:MAG: helix-turn-helix domain-containing protein [Verrucomicrobia bacterium]|nr:helix-turn-helix domain-containing protein [Verrucomicrobiota bacterium]
MPNPDQPAKGAGSTETQPEGVSVAEGARILGLDAFTLYTFIQRDRLRAIRAPSGEIVIPPKELLRLLEESGPC